MSSQSESGAHKTDEPLVRVVLASQSPRRRELLTLIGVAHTVAPADIDESVHENEEPVARSKSVV